MISRPSSLGESRAVVLVLVIVPEWATVVGAGFGFGSPLLDCPEFGFNIALEIETATRVCRNFKILGWQHHF